MRVLIPALCVVLCDRLTKYVIRTSFALGESHQIIQNVFSLTYVQNTGTAFGMFKDSRLFTLVVPAILIFAVGALLFYFYSEEKKTGQRNTVVMISMSLVLGGGTSNFIDRLAFGYVVDMLDFGNFPVFNVADIAITCGCAIIIIYLLLDLLSGDVSEKQN